MCIRDRWRRAAAAASSDVTATITAVREALSDDLDTPRALAAVDEWADAVLGGRESVGSDAASGFTGPGADMAGALDALLGVKL